MQSETKQCQNCKKDFIIEPEDFNFYEKIKVPPPTFCPECRFIRRLAWRNERTLYKRTCDLCKRNIISTYSAKTAFTVYCWDCWQSDKWDAISFGRDYDFSKTFFKQYQELLKAVPHYALRQVNTINSEYSNQVVDSKNVYLSFSVAFNSENIFYSKSVDASFNVFDSYNIKNCDGCYENIESSKNYNSQHLLLCRSCIDSYFLVDCVNCSNCFMSSSLRNKQFYIRNKKYEKENYFKELVKFNLGNRKIRENFINEFETLRENSTYRFTSNIATVNSTGNNLSNTKNCIKCFDLYDSENIKYCYRAFLSKDSMDINYSYSLELAYEYTSSGASVYNAKFSCATSLQTQDVEYAHECSHSTNLFGCVGLKNKENAIFNKIYSKEEFKKLREKIITQMNNQPYIDKKGRIYRYGEFFSIELSPYAYNETVAQEFDPLTKNEAILKGYNWKDPDTRNYNITMTSENIPDNIENVGEDILSEVLGCKHGGVCNHQCPTAFKITSSELQFYKKHGIPIPNKCPNCRHFERFVQIPLPKLYKRRCMCNKTNHFHGAEKCEVEFETSYAPERPEIVYCEKCYQQEVY